MKLVFLSILFLISPILCINPVIYIPGSPVTITGEVNPPSGCPTTGSFIAYGNNSFQGLQDGACFFYYLSIIYNPDTMEFSNQNGVEVSAIEFSEDDATSNDIYAMLEKNGYQFNQSYFMQAYDWRLPPHLDKEFLERITNTIKIAYSQNGNQKIHVIGHSTGGGMTLGLMYILSQSFKDTYIESIITLSGNLAGEIDIFGDLLIPSSDFDGVSSNFSRQLWWTQPAEAWQLPHPGIYPLSKIVITTPSQTYTVNDLIPILKNFGNSPPMLQWYEKTEIWNITGNFTFPNVNTYCLWGQDVPTVIGYKFRDDDFSTEPSVMLGDGDGDQDIITNSACRRWQGASGSYNFYHEGFIGITHPGMTSNKRVLNVVRSIVTGNPPHN